MPRSSSRPSGGTAGPATRAATRRKRAASADSPSSNLPKRQRVKEPERQRDEQAEDCRLKVEDCNGRDPVCRRCIDEIVKTITKPSGEAVDKSRGRIVVEIVAIEQAKNLYEAYSQYHRSHEKETQRKELNSTVREWRRVLVENSITDEVKLGLKQVFPPAHQAEESRDKTIDIVAIHGLCSNSSSAWVAWKDGKPNTTDIHWLKDKHMLPSKICEARIFTYDWNANYDQGAADQKLLGHAKDLLDSLRRERSNVVTDGGYRPIIFVASCFGGLLLAKALLLASQEGSVYKEILRSTAGAMFLGTPFRGSHSGLVTAVQLRIAVAVQTRGEAEVSKDLVRYLNKDGNKELEELAQMFGEMVYNAHFKFPIKCFYETLPTDFTSVIKDLPPEFCSQLGADKKGILVTEDSACLIGPDRQSLPVRHNMLIKYTGLESDGPFHKVSFHIKELVDSASATVQGKNFLHSDSPPKPDSEIAKEIIRALKFSSVLNIEEFKPDKQQCVWILRDDDGEVPNSAPSIFWAWLMSDKPLLWISGKAGCGKTTLMQYLHHEEQSNKQFSNRLNVDDLTVAAYFFFERGSELQKSRQGMIRSLLHQILTKDKTLLRKIFPQEFEDGLPLPPSFLDWDPLKSAFRNVLKEFIDNKKKILLFVDGLDEYRDLENTAKFKEEDFKLSYNSTNDDANWGISEWISTGHKEIANILQDFPKSENIKIIVSSRGLSTFEQAFGKAERVLVHEYTKSTIREYSERRLRDEPRYEIDVTKFVEEIASKAWGVFLWARVVVDMLVRGTFEGDTETELFSRLHHLPEGLSELYSKMLLRIKQEHRREASRLFRLVSEACTPLHPFQLFFAAEGYRNDLGELLGVGDPIRPYDQPSLELESELKIKEYRLSSRSAGLLEVSADHFVQYMHQTAKEFISREGNLDFVFKSLDDRSFDPNLALLSGYIRFLKFDPWQIYNYIPCFAVYLDMNGESDLLNPHSWEPKREALPLIFVSQVHVADELCQERTWYVALVDELDRVCGSICESTGVLERIKAVALKPERLTYLSRMRRGWWYDLCDPNASNFPPGIDRFLRYAVWRDLATYVDEKLQAQDMTSRNTMAESLLSSVVTTWDERNQCITPLEIPQPRTLDVLFRHGASPNMKTRRVGFQHGSPMNRKIVLSTIWADILESGFAYSARIGVTGFRFKGEPLEWRCEIPQQLHTLRPHESSEGNLKLLGLAWARAVIQFLQYRACPNIQIEIGVWDDDTNGQLRTEIMTPMDIIRACSAKPFCYLSIRQIEDLLKSTEEYCNPMGGLVKLPQFMSVGKESRIRSVVSQAGRSPHSGFACLLDVAGGTQRRKSYSTGRVNGIIDDAFSAFFFV